VARRAASQTTARPSYQRVRLNATLSLVPDARDLLLVYDVRLPADPVVRRRVHRLVPGATVESRETFAATPAGNDRGPFLRTGDLGFLLDGELFVTCRPRTCWWSAVATTSTGIEQAWEAASSG
jgi:hypothetical protein